MLMRMLLFLNNGVGLISLKMIGQWHYWQEPHPKLTCCVMYRAINTAPSRRHRCLAHHNTSCYAVLSASCQLWNKAQLSQRPHVLYYVAEWFTWETPSLRLKVWPLPCFSFHLNSLVGEVICEGPNYVRLLVRLKLLNLVNRKVTSVPLEKSTAPLGGIIWAYHGLEWPGKKYIETSCILW